MGKALPSEPLIFLKPPSAVIGPESSIVIPPGAGRVDHEAEVGIVIGRTARNVRAAEARDYVLGLTCVNDVTDRDIQKRDVQYTRAKGFDTFAPIGPAIAVGLDGAALAIGSTVNGVTRQAIEHAGDDLSVGSCGGVRQPRDDRCCRATSSRRGRRRGSDRSCRATGWWSRLRVSANWPRRDRRLRLEADPQCRRTAREDLRGQCEPRDRPKPWCRCGSSTA